MGALIEELADEVPDDPYLETVRADLLAAGRSYETGKKKDLALRFYLAFRSLLREHAVLAERLSKAEAAKANSDSTNLATSRTRSSTRSLIPRKQARPS